MADIANKTYHTINSTLKVVTAHAYWYVGDGHRVDQQALSAAARYFEDHIYVPTGACSAPSHIPASITTRTSPFC